MPVFRESMFLSFAVLALVFDDVISACLLLSYSHIHILCSADVDNKQIRLRAFARVFFACGKVDVGASGPSIDSATGEEVTDLPCVMGLINRLHALLAKMERFEVRVSCSIPCSLQYLLVASCAQKLHMVSLFNSCARLDHRNL